MFDRLSLHLAYALLVFWAVLLSSAPAIAGDDNPSGATRLFTRAEVVIDDATHPPAATASWQAVDLPDDWRLHHPPDREVAWYRFPVDLESAAAGPLAVLVEKASMTAEVWAGDERLGPRSKIRGIPNDFNRPLLFDVPPKLDRSAIRWIYVRISRHAYHSGSLSPIEIGPAGRLTSSYRRALLYRIDLGRLATVLVVLASLFAGTLWLATKRDPINGTFAWAAACCAIVSLNYWIRELPFDRWMWERLIHSALSGFAIGVALWSRRLVRLPISRIDIGLRVYLALLIGVILALPVERFYPTVNYINGVSTLIPIYAGTLVLRNSAALSRSERAFYLLGAVAGITFCAHDLALQVGWLPPDRIHLFTYVMPVAITIFGGSLVARFSSSLDRAEKLNADLEHRVQEKASELEANYDRLGELERERILLLERERLTREMHDGLGGQLVSALALIESSETPSQPIATALRTALADLRTVIDSLDPRIADYGMLFGLLRGRIEPLFEEHEIEVGWRIGDLPAESTLGPEQNLHLLRILQEAFSNAVRHAQASQINFSAEWSGSTLILRVEDDGIGLRSENSSGRGLPNMRMRAIELNAQLEVLDLGSGTRVEIRLPIQESTQTSSAAQ